MGYAAAALEARRRALTEQFGTTQAANAYAYFLRNQQAQREEQDLEEQYRDTAPRVIASYGQRNLAGPNVQSGIFQRALQRFAARKAQQFGYLQQNRNLNEYEYGLSKDNALTGLRSQLSDFETEKANQISEDAQQLLRLRFGG